VEKRVEDGLYVVDKHHQQRLRKENRNAVVFLVQLRYFLFLFCGNGFFVNSRPANPSRLYELLFFEAVKGGVQQTL